jgi:hypothetical protein
MVYAYRGAGSKGVISVPWEKAFFYIERRPRDPIVRAIPYILRCHVLDDVGHVVQSFSVGPRVAAFSDDTTDAGAEIVEELKERLEFIRRYMEMGLSAVTVEELVPTSTSFASARWLTSCDDKVLIAQGNEGIVRKTKLVDIIQSVFAWLSWKTCREPVWPDLVRQASKSDMLAAKTTEG